MFRIPLFVYRVIPIPVPFQVAFPDRNFADESMYGKTLVGDETMPPTAIASWPAFANAIRNAVLAVFWWKTYSVLDMGAWPSKDGAFLVFGAGHVILRKITTRFVAVKHGREACLFAIVNHRGERVRFRVIARGTRRQAIEAARCALRTHDELDPRTFCTFR